ncbi:MAG: hypothetical protein JWM68_2445 [Verrucomicrobiales bacterium]|nr:hypothetical protein [Verrucomicrobiales bacterium]
MRTDFLARKHFPSCCRTEKFFREIGPTCLRTDFLPGKLVRHGVFFFFGASFKTPRACRIIFRREFFRPTRVQDFYRFFIFSRIRLESLKILKVRGATTGLLHHLPGRVQATLLLSKTCFRQPGQNQPNKLPIGTPLPSGVT